MVKVVTQNDLDAVLKGGYEYGTGRDIAKREILEGSESPKAVVLAFLRDTCAEMWQGYIDTYKAILAR